MADKPLVVIQQKVQFGASSSVPLRGVMEIRKMEVSGLFAHVSVPIRGATKKLATIRSLSTKPSSFCPRRGRDKKATGVSSAFWYSRFCPHRGRDKKGYRRQMKHYVGKFLSP